MATFEMEIPDEKIQEMSEGDRGIAVLLEPILNQILQAEMTDHLGAGSGERTDSRSGYRNGTYERKLTTRVGTLELEVPRDRDGTFQTELFQRYQRSEKALVTTLMQMVVQGVSTRRVKNITTELCGREFSRSTVSRLTGDLEKQVDAWAERPLDQEYPFLVLDAMHLDVRRQGAVRSTAVMFAIGIGEDGQREILGLETALSETEQGWHRFIQKLKERGLSGVEVATSDAHSGLKQALQESFPGLIWQRCQAHFKRNVLDQTPSSYEDRMDQVLDQLLKAASQQEAQDRFNDLREELAEEAPSALEVLEGGFFEATAVLALPGKYRRRLRTTKRDPNGSFRKSGAGRKWSGFSPIGSRSTGSSGLSVRRPTRSGRRVDATLTWKSFSSGRPLTFRKIPPKKTSPTTRSHRRGTQSTEMRR
jgi:putative transposase